MERVYITGSGVFSPSERITNDELVKSFNEYVARFNAENAQAIESGQMEALQPSSAEFIEKASGIKARHVVNKSGVLDPAVMHPILPRRTDDELSLQAEMAVSAANQAFKEAQVDASEIQACIAGCSNFERAYPAVSIEVQSALGIEGFAFDMNVACSSATFALQSAYNMVASGQAQRVLVVNPEICSAHLEWRDRDCHFIFGDVATALVLESESSIRSRRSQNSQNSETVKDNGFLIRSLSLKTQFSNNIRNNFGFLNRCTPEHRFDRDKTFYQNGRKVFKEVVPMVADLISKQLEADQISKTDIKRLWLHQANINMNQLICKKILSTEVSSETAPVILDEYANTSSAGSILAFHFNKQGFKEGDIGLLCSFGAGYSVGSLILEFADFKKL